MAWYKVKQGDSYIIIPDGNNIYYPIDTFPEGNKAYLEDSVQAIAMVIQNKTGTSDKYKISEMAGAISGLKDGGLDATYVDITISDYTVVG